MEDEGHHHAATCTCRDPLVEDENRGCATFGCPNMAFVDVKSADICSICRVCSRVKISGSALLCFKCSRSGTASLFYYQMHDAYSSSSTNKTMNQNCVFIALVIMFINLSVVHDNSRHGGIAVLCLDVTLLECLCCSRTRELSHLFCGRTCARYFRTPDTLKVGLSFYVTFCTLSR